MPAVFTFSETGGHLHNEDAFEVRAHPEDSACLLVAIGDGMGGQPGGGPAARLAVKTVIEKATASSAGSQNWLSHLRAADSAVLNDRVAGYTTLIGLEIRDGLLRGASQGDSAAWLLEGGRGRELTTRQPQKAPVGSGGALFLPFEVTLSSPWTLLLMTDGVWKYVGWGPIAVEAARHQGQALIDVLQKRARLPGSGEFQDDFTLIVIHSDAHGVNP